ncbi:hypothetical protein [Cellulomonas phragmiteti]|uniref:DUF222 domain-containing protein n=1 Tax=Cellulomonas phragmiteti TaxID=478780 RepID=A0ABQ4DJ03_9CELL|nr:hypothetical protein [Cellulomonas phragmiteti]GIG39320.1 hypothetical protein Cph01nite_10820 [Cellulomonas phragmiteti]
MKNARDLLDAVAHSAALLNYAAALAPDGAPLSTLHEQIEVLSRAVARAQVLLTIDPDATLDKPMSASTFTDQDRADAAMTIDALETAAAMPSAPITVVMRVRSLGEDSLEDAIRRWIDGQHFTALPGDHRYDLDANRFVAQLAERFLPPADRS